jgi:two-component system response regulator YesN
VQREAAPIVNDLETGRKRTVLLVEDDPEVVNFLGQLLEESYGLAVVNDGKSALEIVGQPDSSPDIILLDYRLPDISGLEVLQQVKKVKPRIPVIFLTAYGDEDVAIKAFRYGAKDYLKKPFKYEEILNLIKFCLSLTDLEYSRQPRNFLAADYECKTNSFNHHSTPDYKIQKALLFINNNYMNKITLDMVAEKACTSKYHFSREFKKIMGYTYQEYLNRLRMEKARKLLKDTGLSITEAAFAVGYTDLTSFERVFKRIVGCTPSRYKYGQVGENGSGAVKTG